MKRDLYAEVSARIIAELEAGVAMVGKPRGEYAVQRGEQSTLLRMQRCPVVDGASGRLSHSPLSHLQAGLGAGRQRLQGRARHEGRFVKQLQVRDDNSPMRLWPWAVLAWAALLVAIVASFRPAVPSKSRSSEIVRYPSSAYRERPPNATRPVC